MALKIKVVKAPTKTGNCGGAEYQVKWILGAGDTGWVIQRVDWNHDVQKCDNTADTALNGAKFCSGTDAPTFWEAWRVENGKVFIGRTNDEHVADTYRTKDHDRRRKKHSITGKVQFVAGYNLTVGNGADDWKENDIPAAMSLPTRKTKPTGWDAASARNHNLTVEWDCCDSPSQPTVTGDPLESDEGSGEKVTKSLPLSASPSAQRLARLLSSLPSWLNLDFNARSYKVLIGGLRRIAAFPDDVIRGGIELFIDGLKRTNKYSLDEQSKLYLLNRFLFELPRSVPHGQLPFFGGWDIPYQGETFNPSWPFVHQPKGKAPVLKGAFNGYMGDEYRAVAEFDYFRKHYPRRRAVARK